MISLEVMVGSDRFRKILLKFEGPLEAVYVVVSFLETIFI